MLDILEQELSSLTQNVESLKQGNCCPWINII